MQTIPTEEEMQELVRLMRDGDHTDATRIKFMRGAVYYGAIAKGLTQAEALKLSQSEHVGSLGKNLNVVVE